MADDRHIPGLALPRTMLRVLGISTYMLAGLGVLISVLSIIEVIAFSPFDDQSPYGVYFFIPALSNVVAIQLCLLFCAQQFMRLRTNVRHILMVVSIAIVVMWIAPEFLFLNVSDVRISMSAALGTGIALSGLTLFLVTLFPIWAPAIMYWAHRRLRSIQVKRHEASLCVHCGYDLRGSKDTCPECGLR